jgi:hypothetical protein
MRPGTAARSIETQPSGRSDERYAFAFGAVGLLPRLYRRFHLDGDSPRLLRRRLLVLTAFAWVPLLALTVIEKRAWSGVTVPFLRDIDAQTRLLIVLPLLIAGETIARQRVPQAVGQFVDRGMIPHAMRARFDAAIESALRTSRSIWADVLMLALVYGVRVMIDWRQTAAVGVDAWNRQPAGHSLPLAGWWFLFVSLPLVQLLFVRWYFGLLVWGRFLWQVSRLDLVLVPTHPDRCAGLEFLSELSEAFAPFLFARSAQLAGTIAGGVVYGGMTLANYEIELVMVPLLALLLVLGPGFAFAGRLWNARRLGLIEYGMLGQRYVRAFESKWLRGERAAGEPLLGTADVQSLADLRNSYEIVERMRVVPITRDTILRLCVVLLLPFGPLPITALSPAELIQRLVKAFF